MARIVEYHSSISRRRLVVHEVVDVHDNGSFRVVTTPSGLELLIDGERKVYLQAGGRCRLDTGYHTYLPKLCGHDARIDEERPG